LTLTLVPWMVFAGIPAVEKIIKITSSNARK
jgi:hypothetical protein